MKKNNVLYLLQTSINLVAPIAIFTYFGYYWGNKYQFKPWGIVGGLIIGSVIAFLILWRDTKKAINEVKKSD